MKNRNSRQRYLKLFLLGLGGGLAAVFLLFWFQAYLEDRESYTSYPGGYSPMIFEVCPCMLPGYERENGAEQDITDHTEEYSTEDNGE